jgi:hypothetical protein
MIISDCLWMYRVGLEDVIVEQMDEVKWSNAVDLRVPSTRLVTRRDGTVTWQLLINLSTYSSTNNTSYFPGPPSPSVRTHVVRPLLALSRNLFSLCRHPDLRLLAVQSSLGHKSRMFAMHRAIVDNNAS